MAKIPEEQKHFLVQDSMQLEFFARNVFGNQYYGSAGWTEMSVWKTFYLDCLKLITNSFDQSVGSIDGYHRRHIFETIEKITENIHQAKRKDDIHKWLIIGLFQLVFLLLGNVPRRMASNKGAIPRSSSFQALGPFHTVKQMSNSVGFCVHTSRTTQASLALAISSMLKWRSLIGQRRQKILKPHALTSNGCVNNSQSCTHE